MRAVVATLFFPVILIGIFIGISWDVFKFGFDSGMMLLELNPKE